MPAAPGCVLGKKDAGRAWLLVSEENQDAGPGVNYLALGYLPVAVVCLFTVVQLMLVFNWLILGSVICVLIYSFHRYPSYRLHAILGTTEDQRSKEACVLINRILPNGELEPCIECLK